MRIVSLFAGCGGLDLGFHRAGHNVVHASDFDEDSVNSYNSYFSKKAHVLDVYVKYFEFLVYDYMRMHHLI